MNLCGSVKARRIHRTFCASFLWEASGRGIAFCHTHVAFCFKTDEKREQSGCQARGDRLLLSFLFLQCSASTPYSVQKRQSSN